MIVYLDLNVFDRIEKKDKLNEVENKIYTKIENMILNKEITVPYSNAHLNDLFRGFQKNPNYIKGHLNNIEKLSNNLCICQYWGRKETTWHYREIGEFFDDKKKDWEFEPETFEELFDENPIMEVTANMYKLIELPKNWKLGYQKEPLFGIMYPKSKTENNMYALMVDIYNFQHRLKTDYSLYKTFKSHLIRSMNKLQNNKEMLKSMRMNFKDLPKHLDIFEISNLVEIKGKDNSNYSKIIETFYKYDLKGYKTDGSYNNMFDDALHTFYASHCDVFVTNDERCKYKAEKTYERLNINTIVITASEYEKIKTA